MTTQTSCNGVLVGGTVNLIRNKTVTFDPTAPVLTPYRPAAVIVSGGLLSVNCDTEIKATQGVSMSSGEFKTVNLPETTTSKVRIEGNFAMSGGTLSMQKIGCEGKSRLEIIGDVSWTGGIYAPVVYGNFNDTCDLWRSSGTFTIGVNGSNPVLLC